jgi:transporter family-2 protein
VEAWLYLGGVIGVAYIMLSAALVAHTGVLLLGLGVVVGQLLASIAIDAVWPAPGGPGMAQEIAMVVLALTGVAIAAAPGVRRRGR